MFTIKRGCWSPSTLVSLTVSRKKRKKNDVCLVIWENESCKIPACSFGREWRTTAEARGTTLAPNVISAMVTRRKKTQGVEEEEEEEAKTKISCRRKEKKK